MFTVMELNPRTCEWVITRDYATGKMMENVDKRTAFRFVKFRAGAHKIVNENGKAVYYG